MCLLCQLPVAKNHNFRQILTFGILGAPVTHSVWPSLVKGGRSPFTDEGQIECATADPQCTFTCQIWSRSVYSVALWLRKKTHFLPFFWNSAFSGVASWRLSEKVEHVCTTTNLPLSNGIKIVSVLQRLRDEIGRTN